MTQLKIITSPSGARFTVAADHADRFSGLVSDLEAAGYGINPKASGGYNPRNIRGSNRPSNHAFGRAIDVNWDKNALGTKGEIPAELARSLAAKHGMTWGGDWSRADPMHFEIAGVPSVPVSQRGITQVAGVSRTMSPERTEMPTYKPVGGQTYMGPEAAQASQGLAKALMQEGLNPGPMRHWTEALGSVLMSGVGGLRNDMALKDMREGQAAGNQALASYLMGGDPAAALQNPYSSDRAMEHQARERAAMLANARAMELQRAKIEAQNADPMRQLQMENIRSQIAERNRKVEVQDKRMADLERLGIDPASAEGTLYLANGKLPESAAKELMGRQQKAKAGPQVAKGLENLSKMVDDYDETSLESAIGPWQGADPDQTGLLSAPFANIARGLGEAWNVVAGGEDNLSAIRSNIRGSTEALAAAIKPLIRGPGEGVWTDADQARLVSIVGDLAQASTKKEFKERLNAVRDRLTSSFNIDVPFDALKEQGAELPAIDVPQARPAQGWKMERVR